MVNFLTRETNESKTAIDLFLCRKTFLGLVEIEGLVTCLLDHDGQMLKLTATKL